MQREKIGLTIGRDQPFTHMYKIMLVLKLHVMAARVDFFTAVMGHKVVSNYYFINDTLHLSTL